MEATRPSDPDPYGSSSKDGSSAKQTPSSDVDSDSASGTDEPTYSSDSNPIGKSCCQSCSDPAVKAVVKAVLLSKLLSKLFSKSCPVKAVLNRLFTLLSWNTLGHIKLYTPGGQSCRQSG